MSEHEHDQQKLMRDQLLDWSSKQARILTGGGKAEEYFTAERGFPFVESELPHYHLMQGTTDKVFAEWRQALFHNDASSSDHEDTEEDEGEGPPANKKAKTADEEDISTDQRVLAAAGSKDAEANHKLFLLPLVGAWTRLLFFGGWEHTSFHDERTFNLQTNNLFIDLRIPKMRDVLLADIKGSAQSLMDLSKEQLRIYARQHVFAGYTQVCRVSTPIHQEDYLCVRHHCVDWNFVGTPRPRPNKWWAELDTASNEVQTWKEWAFATDNRGQHYYCEQWERVSGGDQTQVLALRKAAPKTTDGMILVIGDHFNYIIGRDVADVDLASKQSSHPSLVSLVDDALDNDNLDKARAYLSTQGGHGRVSNGWLIDCAIEPWKEGLAFWNSSDDLKMEGNHVKDCQIHWKGETWNVFDTTFGTVEEIRNLFFSTLK